MHIRFGRGTFGSPDGFAINDFETLPVTTIDDENYTFTGTLTNGGCSWGIATWGTR